MTKQTKTRLSRGLFVDRDVERLRQQLVSFKPFISRRVNAESLAEFDQATEQLLSAIFGEASEIAEAYEYAKVGEAASLINLPEEAQESGTQDIDRESLQQRKRVLESAVSELETHHADKGKTSRDGSKRRPVPRVAEATQAASPTPTASG